MELDLINFFKNYELLGSSEDYKSSTVKSKICRYCDRTEDETTFNQDTHLLPELIGENNILTFDECDICNGIFSGYESHLSTFVRPYITLLGVKGKKKVPTFQSRTIDNKEETRTIIKHKIQNQRELIIKSLDDYSINPQTKTGEIVFRKPYYIPIKVYKSLVKIGLSLLPRNFDEFNKQTFEWLTNRINTQDHLPFVSLGYISTLKKKKSTNPGAYLYRAKKLFNDKQEFPEYILILFFANQIFQIFLPFSYEILKVHDDKKQLILDFFPAFVYDEIEASDIPHKFQFCTFDFGIETPILEDDKILFTYENIEINIPPKQ